MSKVIIIGGGAAGSMAALTAARQECLRHSELRMQGIRLQF